MMCISETYYFSYVSNYYSLSRSNQWSTAWSFCFHLYFSVSLSSPCLCYPGRAEKCQNNLCDWHFYHFLFEQTTERATSSNDIVDAQYRDARSMCKSQFLFLYLLPVLLYHIFEGWIGCKLHFMKIFKRSVPSFFIFFFFFFRKKALKKWFFLVQMFNT